jgi:hypothetical protein
MISATMPSVAYARMINGEGVGVGVMVGTSVGDSVGTGVGVAEAVQEVSRMASKPRLERKRDILSKGQVETISQLSHDF